MRISFKKYIILICVIVLSLSAVAQIKVINNKGTFFQVDTSKWSLVGVDIYNKNQIGNVGVGTFPYNARFVVDNGNSAILPAFKLKYPFTGAVSDSILTWNPADSTVRKITLLQLLTGNAIISLNGLTASTQTFATGTTGSDFNIISSGSTHTFNLPDASSTNRGALSNTDWITFNNKISSVTATTAAAVSTVGTTATILNTVAYWNANQLQGYNISATAPNSGQVLSWNGTSWIPTNAADGSETKINNGTNTTITGAGTIASPYQVNVADATTAVKGVIQLAGDLTGTATSPQIAASAVTTNEILNGTIVAADIASNAITTVKILNSNVTYAKIQNVTAQRLLGNPTGAAAPPSEISLGSGLSFSSNILNTVNNGTVTSVTGTAPIVITGTPTSTPNVTITRNNIVTGASSNIATDPLVLDAGATNAVVGSTNATLTVNNTAPLWNANQIQGKNISTTSPTNGQILTWNNTSSFWEPSTYVTNAWNLTGNASTNPATNFLGTTDAQRLVFRTNNIERMTILSGGNVGIGEANPTHLFHLNGTNPIRIEGLQNNTTDTNLLVTTSTGVIQQRGILNLLSGKAILSLNGLTGSIQTFATGTTGTDFNIVSSGSAHTFNFPNASSANRGLLINTDWISFNNKIGTVTATTAAAVTTVGTTATINNTGAYWNANQLQNRNVSSTLPTNGQVLTWNTTSSLWEPSTYVTNAWNLTGNASTNPATNFLGTTDAQRLVFRTNNIERMTILSGGFVGIGEANPTHLFHLNGTNPIRIEGLQNNTIDTNLLVTTSTGVIQQRGILNLLSGKAILSLNGLTGSIQTFATGTTGTDFNIVSSGSAHTFNFPNASSANRGLLINTDWISFNNKIGTVTATTAAAVTTVGTTATINNTGAYWNANQIQTRNVASTAPTDGQVLSWNNTNSQWEPSGNTYQSAVVEIYDAAGTQALTSSFANITFGSTNIADAGFTVGGSGSQITVTTAGTYRITYRISARCTTNQGNAAEFQLTRNGTYVAGTRGYSKHHNSDRPHGTVTVVKILALSANDIIRVQGRQYSSNGSISLSQDGSSLIIERIK